MSKKYKYSMNNAFWGFCYLPIWLIVHVLGFLYVFLNHVFVEVYERQSDWNKHNIKY